MFDVVKDEKYYVTKRDFKTNKAVIDKTFETYNELLYFIKKQYKFGYSGYRPGVTDLISHNDFLMNYAHNFNDAYNRWQWDTSADEYRHYFQYCVSMPKMYMCWDVDNRILNIADLAQDSFDLDDAYRPPNRYYNGKWRFRHELWEKRWEFRKTRLRTPHMWCYRRIQTTQERRWACSDEHKPFIRAKRNKLNIPNSWDDINYARRGYGWKSYSKKKKQWM